jgi:polar amino acid transport system substrate-binding protein
MLSEFRSKTMIKKVGYCENSTQCTTAQRKEPIDITDANTLCPECGSDLEGERIFPWGKIVLLGGTLLILLFSAFGAYRYFFQPQKTESQNNNSIVKTTPSPTLNIQNECSSMPLHKNVWDDISRRGYIIMGVQADADPMNYTGKNKDDEDGYEISHTEWEKARKAGEAGEQKRREGELKWGRTGFDYDLMKLLAKEMGIENVKGREVQEFRELFCFLNRQEKNGDFSADLVMSGIAKDNIYSETVSWSKPYLDLYYSLVTKKSSEIQTINDLKGKKIGIVQSDNVVKRFLETQIQDAIPVPLDDGTDEWMFNAFKENKVDAVIQDYPFAVTETEFANTDEKLAKNDKKKQLEIRITRLKSNDSQFDPQYVIGVPKGEEELLARINEAIKKVVGNLDDPDSASKEYKDLVQSYLQSENIKAPEIKDKSKAYSVNKGDSLSVIALKELGEAGRWREIADLNNIANNFLIVPKQLLLMPSDWKGKVKEKVIKESK